VLAVNGSFLQSSEEFVFVNVYAPCDMRAQHLLRDNITRNLSNYVGKTFVCLRWLECGLWGGGVVKWSVWTTIRLLGCSSFNRFIVDNYLVDLPLVGRSFTWYRRDGHLMSCLEKFMLSKNWCGKWPNCNQVAQTRSLSDCSFSWWRDTKIFS